MSQFLRMSHKAIPIRSFRTFQRYMGVAVKFQINSFKNMRACEQTAAGKLTTHGVVGNASYFDPINHGHNGWLDADLKEVRGYTKQPDKYLAIRAIVAVPKAVAA